MGSACAQLHIVAWCGCYCYLATHGHAVFCSAFAVLLQCLCTALHCVTPSRKHQEAENAARALSVRDLPHDLRPPRPTSGLCNCSENRATLPMLPLRRAMLRCYCHGYDMHCANCRAAMHTAMQLRSTRAMRQTQGSILPETPADADTAAPGAGKLQASATKTCSQSSSQLLGTSTFTTLIMDVWKDKQR